MSEYFEVDASAAMSNLGVQASEPVGLSPVCQLPFEGWAAFADVVSESNPELAGLMAVSADIARAVVEEHSVSFLDQLGGELGLSDSALAGIRAEVLAHRLALTPQALSAELAAIFTQVPGDDIQSFTGEDGLRLIGAAIRAFLDSPRAPAPANELYEATLQQVKERAVHPALHWRAACSLEPPGRLGTQPIHCVRLGHPFWDDRLTAVELPYGQAVIESFSGKVEAPGAVGVGPHGSSEFPIDEDPIYVSKYFDTIRAPTRAWSYTLHMTEGPGYRRASRLAGVLRAHSDEISDLVRMQVERTKDRVESYIKEAGNAAGGAAAVLATALAPCVIPLAAAAAKAVVTLMVSKLVTVLKEKNHTAWTIWHTTVMAAERVPISIFTLACPGQLSPGLCRLKTDPHQPPSADENYEFDPNERRQARFMVGPSKETKTQIDQDYFDLAAKMGQPIAWQEPYETNSGFRVLLPHRAQESKASYVSAISADVRLLTNKKFII
jgi:hypothetical protein